MYSLKSGIFFVKGAVRGAILDTNSTLVYSVNERACEVLSYVISDEPYWKHLISIGIAEQTSKPFIQKLPIRKEPINPRFVWFEITEACNERCIHCYATPLSHGNDANGKSRMTYGNWVRIIQDVYSLGGKACQFIGGEPFLYRGENGETVLELVKVAKEVGFSSIEIFTNATLLNTAKIKEIKHLGVKVAVSLYSDNPDIHDSITNIPGSHAKTMESIRLLKQFDVQTRVEIVIMRANERTIDSSLQFREVLGCYGRRPNPLQPSGRGSNRLIQPSFEALAKYGLKLQPNFKVDINTLTHYVSGHSCLMGKLAVTEFGEVLPCVFSRRTPLGNILSSDLKQIVKEEAVQRIWHSTKDDVMVCRDCEYRYVCHDCRPLSYEIAAGNASYLTSPYPRCTYNPYIGQWGKGVWRVSENGKPFYDENLHQAAL